MNQLSILGLTQQSKVLLTLFLCISSNFLSASVICLPLDFGLTSLSTSLFSASSSSDPAALLFFLSTSSSLRNPSALSRILDDSATWLSISFLSDVVIVCEDDFFFFFLNRCQKFELGLVKMGSRGRTLSHHLWILENLRVHGHNHSSFQLLDLLLWLFMNARKGNV